MCSTSILRVCSYATLSCKSTYIYLIGENDQLNESLRLHLIVILQERKLS